MPSPSTQPASNSPSGTSISNSGTVTNQATVSTTSTITTSISSTYTTTQTYTSSLTSSASPTAAKNLIANAPDTQSSNNSSNIVIIGVLGSLFGIMMAGALIVFGIQRVRGRRRILLGNSMTSFTPLSHVVVNSISETPVATSYSSDVSRRSLQQQVSFTPRTVRSNTR